MKIVLALLALILCASTQQVGFMQQMIQNARNAQYKLDDQRVQSQKLIQQMMDYKEQDLEGAAAAAPVDPVAALTAALDGTIKIIEEWKSFTGDIIESSGLKEKVTQLQSMQKDLEEAAGPLARDALITFNSAIWGIDKNVRAIQDFAKQLKDGCNDVKDVTLEVSDKANHLQGDDKVLYEVALDQLIETLNIANTNSNKISDDLDVVIEKLNTCIGKMQAVQVQLTNSADGIGASFDEKVRNLQLEIYLGVCGSVCIIGAAFPPACLICFGVSAPILQNNIVNWRQEIEETKRRYIAWQGFFGEMERKTSQARTTAQFWYGKINDFKNEVSVLLVSSQRGKPGLLINRNLRTKFIPKLDVLMKACDVLIKETKGKLVGTALDGIMPKQKQVSNDLKSQMAWMFDQKLKHLNQNDYENGWKITPGCIRGCVCIQIDNGCPCCGYQLQNQITNPFGIQI